MNRLHKDPTIGGAAFVYTNDAQALLSLSVSLIGTVASRPEDRVQHLEIQQYGIYDATVDGAAEAAVAHLLSPRRRPCLSFNSSNVLET
jgi:hypothetical protein